jgi:hypothetical protein
VCLVVVTDQGGCAAGPSETGAPEGRAALRAGRARLLGEEHHDRSDIEEE